MTFSRVGMVLSVAVVAALGLGGCTGEPGPILTTTPTPSVTEAQPTPSPTEPAELTYADVLAMMPEGAEYQDLRGAVVTASAFIAEYAHVYRTHDSRLWEALSADGCTFCESVLSNVQQHEFEGITTEGGEVSVDDDSIDAGVGESDGKTYVTLVATALPSSEFDSGGALLAEYPGSTRKFVLQMELVGDLWVVNGVNLE